MAGSPAVEALVGIWEAVLRRGLRAALAAIQDGVPVARIVQLLERRDIEGAIAAVGLDPAAFRPLDAAIRLAFEAGGAEAAAHIPARLPPSGLPPSGLPPSATRLQIRFDVRNPRAETWLREHSSALVAEILADQRQAVRQHFAAGMAAGQSAGTIAAELVGRIDPASRRRGGGVIGLTAAQEEWSRRYAAELARGDPAALTRALRDKRFDRAVREALRAGVPIPAEQRDEMVACYRARAFRHRVETLGRTETMRAVHKGQIEAFEQAIAAGQVEAAAVTKVWHAAGDARVRDTHRALHGKAVALRAAFVTPSGARLQFPGDPDAPASETVQCRCSMAVRIDHRAAAVTAGRSERAGAERAPTPGRDALDAAAREEVLRLGRADGKEHLAGFDLDTGEAVTSLGGDRADFVGFTPALAALLEDAGRRLVLHHNHPSSTSLSRQDLRMLSDYPGLHEVVAHGHDGSLYWARLRGAIDFNAYVRFADRLHAGLWKSIEAGQLDFHDVKHTLNHLLNTLLARAGIIDYAAELAGRSLSIVEANRGDFERLLAKVARRARG